MKKILITGGSGYKGVVLIKKLIMLNYKIINIDTNYFGNYFIRHKNVNNIKCDIRDIKKINFKNIYACIHLAGIANDPMTDLNQSLSWEITALGTKLLMDKLVENNVKKIIFASSGSVYGTKKKNEIVSEKIELNPMSTYNKVKMVTENIILSYAKDIKVVIIRPATVCGFSPRMRLDLTVNLLTFQALKNKKIIVFGGNQTRPNVHIEDIVNTYIFFLKRNITGIFNVGFENYTIIQIAKIITNYVDAEIFIKKDMHDPRSYFLDSSKLLKTGFKPKKGIKDAIKELKHFYDNKILQDKKNYHSIKWLKQNIKKFL